MQSLSCTRCGYVSRSAPAFSTLFLPLPTDWLRTISVVVWRMPRVAGVQHAVRVDRNATLAELVAALLPQLGDAAVRAADVRLVDLHGSECASSERRHRSDC